jgi:hypothetical protein
MKRFLSLAAVAAVALAQAGCGGTACTSNPAPLPQSSNTSCTLAAGSTATIDVALCGKCTDTSPGCQAEFLTDASGTRLEVSPTVQQCQENAGCNIASGCALAPPHATCTVTIPASATGSYNLVILGDTQVQGQLTIGSGSSCQLL